MLFPEKACIKTDKASLSLHQEGYVKVMYTGGNLIESRDYLSVLDAIKKLSKGVKLPSLSIYPENSMLSKEILEGGLLDRRKDASIAEALVVKSFSARFWINYYSGMIGGYPLRAFRTEESALKWISGFLLN